MERWKPVPGYEGRYEASDLGRVRSVDRLQRTAAGPRQYRGKILAPGTMNEFGHQSVQLGKGNSVCVHDAVLSAFVGCRPPGCEARHLNLVGSDNRLENLRWGTRSENGKDVTAAGARRLTYEQANEIRRRRAFGERGTELAKEFGISRSEIYWIEYGHHYV